MVRDPVSGGSHRYNGIHGLSPLRLDGGTGLDRNGSGFRVGRRKSEVRRETEVGTGDGESFQTFSDDSGSVSLASVKIVSS